MGGLFGGGGGSTTVTQTATQQQDINITNTIDFDALGTALDSFATVYKELQSNQTAVDNLQASYMKTQLDLQAGALQIEAAKTLSTLSVTEKVSAAITLAVLVYVIYKVYKGAKK